MKPGPADRPSSGFEPPASSALTDHGDDVAVRMTEAHHFRSRCASHVAARDAELATQRHKRGLYIQWSASPKHGVFTNLWGAGHTLPVACRLHQLCRRVRRFCYISIYDTSFEDYFGYANGESWKPQRPELIRYTRNNQKKKTLTLNCSSSRHNAAHEPFIEGELLRCKILRITQTAGLSPT